MHRIIVDLPEPDGPQTTTFSFSPTIIETSRSTCSAPYHLFTLSRTIAAWFCVPAPGATLGALFAAWLMTRFPRSAAMGTAELPLKPAAVSRHGKAETDVDN